MSAARPARDQRGPAAWVIGLAFLVLLAFGSYLAYTKKLPFAGDGYVLRATFDNAATLTSKAPVRIAGVKVGEVIEIERQGEASEVTFTVSDEGQPIHEDAEIKVRPRLFLEGNFFLDVHPGSPGTPELASDAEIPSSQTSTAVQLDELLTSLQTDSRRNLQELLKGYGTALTYEPTTTDDRGHDPDVAGENAARSVNDSFRYGGDAGRDTAIVNEALLGRQKGDLGRLISESGIVFSKLASRESELKDLITNFNVVAGALATEQVNLRASIRELAPTLEAAEPSLRHLSEALPPLRALAIELEPSIRELPGTIKAAGPWLEQTKKLLRQSELGGLSKQLAEIGKPLGRTSAEGVKLFGELTQLSRCAVGVLNPSAETVITVDPNADGVGEPVNATPNFNEFLFSLAAQSGETASFDGNGVYLRLQAGGGPQLAQSAFPATNPGNTKVFANTIEDPTGTQPRVPTTGLPPFRTDVSCASNPVPAINGPAAAVGPASPDGVP